MNRILTVLTLAILISAMACKKKDTGSSNTKLIFKFRFDSTQARLNNIGQPSTIPAGNAAQSGVMNKMSAHYIELTPGALTPLGQGAVLYRAAETTLGGSNAIDFEKAPQAGNGETFYEVPIKNIAVGEYE